MKSTTMSDVGWCKAMKGIFTQHGLDADALFAEAGLDPSYADVDLSELADAFSRAWSLAASRTGNAAIGLTRPAHPLVSLGVLSHAVLAAPDVRGVLQCIARYAHIISPTASAEMRMEGDLCVIQFALLKGKQAVAPSRFDNLGVTFMFGLRWITGFDEWPVVFHHPGPQPEHPERWQEAFGCTVIFNAPACMLTLPMSVLTRPIPTADPMVSELSGRLAAQVADQQGGFVSARVRHVLTRLLAKGDPRRETVASELCMSERTLQRRLTEEGTSFAELVDDVRRETAERYFRHGEFSPTEMTFALGFSDPSNFYRACKRWFGRTPSHMRATD